MAEVIISFNDYVSHLTAQLRSLRHFERCVFSAWCSEQLLTTHAGLIEQSLSESDLKVLQNVLDEIWDVLLAGLIPDAKMLNALDEDFLQMGPEDPIAAIEVHPVVTSVESAIGICILGCRRNDVGLAQRAGEAVIDVLDYEIDERNPDYSTNSLQEMFEHAEMKSELNAQLAMIKHLGGQYKLDDKLRSVFRQ